MARWNPFRAIGDAVGRVFGGGRSEEPAIPTPQPERQPEPAAREPEPRAERQQPEPQERGFFGRVWDRIRGAERRIEERERAVAPPPQPQPGPELPKFGAGGPGDFLDRDEKAFGEDNDIVRAFEEAVADFIADRGGLDGLGVDAREWLESPTISGPFSEYWTSGGFTSEQVLAGMTDISNITITEGEDGDISIEFDYDADVDGYEVHGHASV